MSKRVWGNVSCVSTRTIWVAAPGGNDTRAGSRPSSWWGAGPGQTGQDESAGATPVGSAGASACRTPVAQAVIQATIPPVSSTPRPVSYTHLRAHETDSYLVCRLL